MMDGTTDSAAELKPLRIFICSSGDMIAERQAALRVIVALNRSAHGAARLEPYLWEENAHRFQGAHSCQSNIPLPAEFDIFLGFLFSRIGSRLTEEEYRRDILAKLATLRARLSDDGAASDPMTLTQLTEDMPYEALPTGTTFEILNARDAAQRPGGDGRPCLWLAVNSAVPKDLTSRDRDISGLVQQRWNEVSQFVADELNARHVPVFDYGADVPRAQQQLPGGLQTFEEQLDRWLAETLSTQFGVHLRWFGAAYIGLDPFEAAQAPIFLGRSACTREALDLLDQLAQQDKPTLMLLAGPSGAGKSSFARAGLIGNIGSRRLHRRRVEGSLREAPLVRSWRHLATRPADLSGDPAGALLEKLGELLAAPGAFEALAAELAALPFATPGDTVPPAVAAPLHAAVQGLLAQPEPRAAPALFLLLDQLEDLLAADRVPETRRLLALLGVLADCAERNIWVVVAVADQWRATLGSAGLTSVLEGAARYFLPPPRVGELREIITVPARRAGLVFERAADGTLDQVILGDIEKLSLHAEAPLPLLQVALERLEKRKVGNRLTTAAYREMGGIAGAIASHARDALAEWQSPERRDVLDRLLFHLVQRDPQRRIVCRLASRRELEADPEMRALEEHLVSPKWRLLQGHGPEKGSIRIAHDVLLNHAEAFRDFVERRGNDVLLLGDTYDAAARWAGTEGRPRELLIHHLPNLERLEKLFAPLRIPADDDLAAFVEA